MNQNMPQAPSTESPAKKKGLPPLAWVGIGCGGVLLLGIIVIVAGGLFVYKKASKVVAPYSEKMQKNPVLASAEIAASNDPKLEVVNADYDKGVLTIRNKETGETITYDASQLKEGKFTVKNADGEVVTMDTSNADSGTMRIQTKEGTAVMGAGAASQVPDWVPAYPAATVMNATSSRTTSEGKATLKGGLTLQTTDAPAKASAQYDQMLKKAEYSVKATTVEGAGGMCTIEADSKDGQRKIHVAIIPNEGGAMVTLAFEENAQTK